MPRLLFAALLALALLPSAAQGAALHTVASAAPSAAASVYGTTVAERGSILPADAGVTVVLQQQVGAAWVEVGRAATTAGGGYAVPFSADRSGALRVRIDGEAGTETAGGAIAVRPRIVLLRVSARAFVGARVRLQVLPARLSGPVILVARQGRRVVGRRTAWLSGGRVAVRLPLQAFGAFRISLRLPARSGLVARRAVVHASAVARTLRRGAVGADVAGLERRLAALHVFAHAGTAFDARSWDSVIAFQKLEGLARTGVVDASVWRALSTARPPRPRGTAPGSRIEVDKTRQLLFSIAGGRVVRVVAVSTGRYGNTPEGRFSILAKLPWAASFYGGTLYRSMTFHGRFAIHGYPDVPEYPASHGCIRVPLWIADWLYQHTPLGDPVVVYP